MASVLDAERKSPNKSSALLYVVTQSGITSDTNRTPFGHAEHYSGICLLLFDYLLSGG